MSDNERHEKGMALRAELIGPKFVERMNQDTYQDPIMQKFRDVAAESVFGSLWTRPGLDLKTRTLVCVISDVATGREPELAIHLRMARRQGWSEEELSEAILHLTGYVGAPLVREAMLTASRVFQDINDNGMDEALRATAIRSPMLIKDVTT